MKSKTEKIIGFKGIINSYGLKDFLIDSILPLIITVITLWGCIQYELDYKGLVDKIANLCVAILPSYLGLLVAAYTILLSLVSSEVIKTLMATENPKTHKTGKDLVRQMNGGFASCVLIAATCLLSAFIVSVVSAMNLESEYAAVLNCMGIGALVFLISFSLTVLYGLIQDLFNIGQSATIL